MGRPSSFTQETADEICEWIAAGNSLDSWIKAAGDRPSWPTVCKWLDEREAFLKSYLRAREAQADAIFDECLRIADTPMAGEKVTEAPTGTTVTTGDMLDHRKLQIDTRMRMAGKLSPKKYGEKLDVTSGGKPVKYYAVVDPADAIFSDKTEE